MRQTRLTFDIDRPLTLEIIVMEDGAIYIHPQNKWQKAMKEAKAEHKAIQQT